MKLNQAIVSLSIAAATPSVATVASSHEDLKEDNLLPTLLTHKSADYLHRMMSITDMSSQCYNDTEAIIQNESFISGIVAVMESCPQAQSQSGNSITVDYSVCDPAFTNSLTEICTAAGGQIVSGVGDVSLTCSLNGETISVSSKGVPECIATSCNVTNWEAEKDQLFDEGVKEVEALFEAFGMECTFNSAGKVTGMLALAVTSVAAAIIF